MRRFIFLMLTTFGVLMLFNPISAQPDLGDMPEPQKQRIRLHQEIENLRIWKLTKYLNLTSEQAKNFFPAYNEFRDKLNDLNDQKAALVDKISRSSEVDDYPADKLKDMVIQMEDLEEKQLKLKRDFRKQTETMLSENQVAKLKIFEFRFQQDIQRLLQDAHERRMKQRRPFIDR